MAQVTLKDVVKRFGQLEIVKKLSLEIHDGEFMVLVGPSGCGKTTTLRAIAGLETIDAGEIYIGERRVNDLAPKDRDIAMVFQNYALYPHMNVFDNIAFGLKLRKVPRPTIEEKVQNAADMLGLKHLLTRKPKELSGGQRQRVALARALVRQPHAFLMDEPLSNLDAKLRAQTRTELKKLHQGIGTTTIYVTHDQIEAMTMGDRIAVMKEGIIQQLAPPKQVYQLPANVFVAGFIGSPAMNFLKVRLTDVGAGGATVQGEGVQITLPLRSPERLQGHREQEMILGIRPENIAMPPDGQDGTGRTITAKVEVVEPSGSRTYLQLMAGHHALTVEVDTASVQEVRPGDTLSLLVDVERVHLFDAHTEQVVLSTLREKLGTEKLLAS